MELTLAEWVTIIVGMLLSVGGAIGTLIMILLGFIIKRLIKSIDDLIISNDELKLAVNDRPVYSHVEDTAEKIANNRVIQHESEKH